MQKVDQYIVDAFVGPGLRGNPAAVCVLEDWLPDNAMLRIAEENRYSETAFVVGKGPRFHLRWFTPLVEVDLCGHATIATAYVLCQFFAQKPDEIIFETKSGDLTVERRDEYFIINLPARDIEPCQIDVEQIAAAIGFVPIDLSRAGPTIIATLPETENVREVSPQMDLISKIDCSGLIVTAQAKEVDFVSRFFGPRIGLGEDPATGSAHCGLAPYWSGRLNKSEFTALQLSPRGAELVCSVDRGRVSVGGRVELFAVCELHIGSSYYSDVDPTLSKNQ